MTLNDAICIQEKWMASSGKLICKHTQLFDHIMSETGEKTNYLVCLVCGEVYGRFSENYIRSPSRGFARPMTLKKVSFFMARNRL